MKQPDDLPGEALNRRYWELRGWTCCTIQCGYGMRPGIKYDSDKLQPLPALHLDANLLLAELDRVFAADGKPYYDLYRDSDTWTFDPCDCKSDAQCAIGEHAFCEAGLKALIAAKESQ